MNHPARIGLRRPRSARRSTSLATVLATAVGAGIVAPAGGAAQTAQATESTPIAVVSWMTGCWQAMGGAEEMWTDGTGGQMFGINRTIRDGRAARWEFLRIYEGRSGLIYAAAPSHQPPAEFESTAATRDSVVFVNAQHDFPTRIAYQLAAGDSLFVTVSGPGDDGTTQGFRISFGRGVCMGR